MFSAACEDQPFRVFAVDIASREMVNRLEGTGASAQAPVVSADGRTLVYVGYTPAGYDLFSIQLGDARWTPVHNIRPAFIDVDGPAASADPRSRAYSPWRTLTPQFWTPTVESDADELVVGAAIGSVDALGRHACGVEAGWTNRSRPDWQIAYAYDRWLPTASRIRGRHRPMARRRGAHERARRGDVASSFPCAVSFTPFASFHVEDDLFSVHPATTGRRRATRRTSLHGVGIHECECGCSVSAEEVVASR